MRSRTLALIILFLFLIIPSIVYWYFYQKNVSSIIFQSDSSFPYTVKLEGTFSYKYLPLLDRAFLYESVCQGSCIFSPLPPLEYKLIIESTGKIGVTDTLRLNSGEQKKYKVKLSPSLELENIPSLPNFQKEFLSQVGLTQEGDMISLGQQDVNGVYVNSSRRESPLFRFPLIVESARLDMSRMFILFQGAFPSKFLTSLDGRESIEFPYEEEILFVRSENGIYKVRTNSGIYEYRNLSWIKNPRFTDFIDISPEHRIGYVDKGDIDKLRLQNLQEGQSYFILLDRTSAQSEIIKKGEDIRGFFSMKDTPILMDSNGNLKKIIINTQK